MLKYTGYIRKIRYYSESSHYIVALLEVEEDQELLTMNGYMSNFNDYDKYAFYESTVYSEHKPADSPSAGLWILSLLLLPQEGFPVPDPPSTGEIHLKNLFLSSCLSHHLRIPVK